MWRDFYDKMETRTFKAGEIIYERGQKSTHFFVLRKGIVLFLLKEEEIDKKEIKIKDNEFCSIYKDRELKRRSNEKMHGADKLK
jgi:CRP-like cAMP-binding protein